jgi:hypothetical protein
MRVALLLMFALALPAQAQNWGTIAGRVVEAATGDPIPGATLLIEGTNYGTATTPEGQFEMRAPAGRYPIRVSAIGYQTLRDTIAIRRGEVTAFSVRLQSAILDAGEVTVQATAGGAGVFTMDPRDVQNIPGPFRTPFHAIRVLPGVAGNNELSNQFSVRGGGLNENLIFLNGYEVYLPFRPRQGEQEGLGILNPDLTESLTLYTGGFPARYGGRLSSALDVRYARPVDEPVGGSVSVSTLDAAGMLRASSLGGRLGWIVGARRAQAASLFGSQDLDGQFDPEYVDVQGAASYAIAPGHELEATGLWLRHRFNLQPTSRLTYNGVISLDPTRPSDFQSVFSRFSGREESGYTTAFGGLRLKTALSRALSVEHDVSLFDTDEFETRRIQGQARLSQVDPGSGDSVPLGDGEQLDEADNRIRVTSLTGQGRYRLLAGSQALEAGWLARRFRFEDRIDELAELRALDPVTREPSTRVLRDIDDGLTLETYQAGAYAQSTFGLLPGDRLVATVGLRADYFDFTGEWTLSPRLSAQYEYTVNTTLNAAAGVYHQTPTYQELRGERQTVASEGLASALNRDLESQRALQFVAGGEHFFEARRLYLRVEGYFKALSNLITYDFNNSQIRYAGRNDADGHIYGFDVQLRGEMVPGLESWFNYGFLVAREDVYEQFEGRFTQGVLRRPTDQRHTFSLFVQDYIPGDQSWKLHTRVLFGSGYPFTPLNAGPTIGGIRYPEPAARNSFSYPEYRRMDLGVTKEIPFGNPADPAFRIDATAEILNIFDMDNEVASTYVATGDRWKRVPTRLTPRTYNVRMRVTF